MVAKPLVSTTAARHAALSALWMIEAPRTRGNGDALASERAALPRGNGDSLAGEAVPQPRENGEAHGGAARSGERIDAASVARREELERLGDEIAELAAHVHAAMYQLLVRLREFDERDGWSGGFRSCAHWLSWRTGIAPGAAREKVRVARALAHLPQLSDAMRRGELSYAKVPAATRVATIENELELLMLAQHGTAAHMERVVRAWRRVDRLEELREESDRYRRRHLTLYVDEDGSYVIHGRLDPETGALLERALEAAGTALLRKGRDVRGNVVEPSTRSGCAGPLARSAESARAVIAGSRAAVRASGVPASPRYDGLEPDSPLQGRVDALGVVAEYALRSELGAPGSHDDDEAAHGSHDEPQVECDAATMSSNEVPSPGSPDGRGATKRTQPLGRADRFQVIVHVDAQALRESSDTGQSVLDDGIRVSAETSRRLACDASRVVMLHDTGGDVLDVGRRTRTVPSAIRRALVHRDRGCRFPGCGARFCDAHHIVHWADGGRTRLDNLVLLCRRHHRAVHEEGFRLTMTAAGEVCVVLPNGTRLREVPAPPRLADDPVLSIERVHAELGIAIDAWTPTPLWHGERLDLGLAILSLRGGCQAGTDGTGTSGVATAVPEAIPGGR
jgi:hypothetical protein